MGSGPRAGLAEIFLPELQKGSSIMPGKVNPVIPEVVTQVAAQVIGNDAAITVGGMQGHFELNVFIPLMARNLLGSIRLLASASRLLAEKCVDGIEANREQCERYAELTLSAATALNPFIGYDKATEIVKDGRRDRAARCARSRSRPASRNGARRGARLPRDGQAARRLSEPPILLCRMPPRHVVVPFGDPKEGMGQWDLRLSKAAAAFATLAALTLIAASTSVAAPGKEKQRHGRANYDVRAATAVADRAAELAAHPSAAVAGSRALARDAGRRLARRAHRHAEDRRQARRLPHGPATRRPRRSVSTTSPATPRRLPPRRLVAPADARDRLAERQPPHLVAAGRRTASPSSATG